MRVKCYSLLSIWLKSSYLAPDSLPGLVRLGFSDCNFPFSIFSRLDHKSIGIMQGRALEREKLVCGAPKDRHGQLISTGWGKSEGRSNGGNNAVKCNMEPLFPELPHLFCVIASFPPAVHLKMNFITGALDIILITSFIDSYLAN